MPEDRTAIGHNPSAVNAIFAEVLRLGLAGLVGGGTHKWRIARNGATPCVSSNAKRRSFVRAACDVAISPVIICGKNIGKDVRDDAQILRVRRSFCVVGMNGEPFAGKVALVTGAGRRIGRSIAVRLAAEGAAVAVNYSKSCAAAEEVVAQIVTNGGRAVALQADVSRRTDVEKLFAALDKEFGRLDILVNNAGIFFPAKFEELTDEQWDRIQNTNLKSQFLCSQAAVPMLRRAGGHIINISSLGAFLVWPSYTHYCVSKAGSVMLTKCLAVALGPEIMVNSIAPGTITFPGEPPHENFIKLAPLHKTGTGDDIADAVVYLASSKFVTGQVITVDGGRVLVS